ncbi:MAG TPA: hypothetical protein VF587_15895 [Solirubrobacteraceae bacterium]
MDVAIVISSLSLAVAAGGLLWNRNIWRLARKTDVRVMAWHDGSGVDIYGASPDAVETEDVIAVRVFNHGEQSEYVMWTGVESVAGEPLADDKPTAARIVDEPPPKARTLAPRAQIATDFKVPAHATGNGFIGYAVLGTGERVYSVPAMPDTGLDDIHTHLLQTLDKAGEEPED